MTLRARGSRGSGQISATQSRPRERPPKRAPAEDGRALDVAREPSARVPGRPNEEPDKAQVALFDELAALTTDPDAGFAELTARYQADPRLTVPATVRNGVLNRVDEV
jgi:alpha-ketoglutarate-dependent taurine dioxygenase